MASVYHGNCHCGRFRFELTEAGLTEAIVCGCTLCAKKGYLWIRPTADCFSVTRDEGSLIEYDAPTLKDKVSRDGSYQGVNDMASCIYVMYLLTWSLQFCDHCGTGVLGEHGSGSLSGQQLVNIRAIQEINPFKLRCGFAFCFHSFDPS